jgi:ABC-type glycerol-3-phosphate transport system substrate-binding protein
MLTGLIKEGEKQPLLLQFEEEEKITVDFIFAPEDAIRDKIWTDLISKTGSFDVLGVDCYAVPEFAYGKFVDPLDQYVDKADPNYFKGFDDFYQSTLDANTYEGKLYALPTYCFGGAYTYRRDLFEKYGVQPPQTFADLEPMCKQLKDAFEGDGLDMAPFTMRGIRGEEPTIETSGAAWAYGGSWFENNARTIDEIKSQQAKPTLNTQPWVESHDYCARLLREYGPPGIADYSWYECAKDVAEGRAASFLGFSAMYWFVKATAPELPTDDFGIALAPMGPERRMQTFWTFSYFINTDSKKKDAAWKVTQLIASPQHQWLMGETNLINTLPLKSIMEGEDIKTATKTSDEDMETIKESFRVSSIEYAPFIPEYKPICHLLGTAFNEIITQANTAQGALDYAQKETMTIMEEAGYYD